LREGKTFLFDIPGPSPLNNPLGIFSANVDRSISRKRVNDHNFIAPLHTFQAATDIGLFVKTDNTTGNQRTMIRADDVWKARGGVVLLPVVAGPAAGIFTVLLIAEIKNLFEECLPLSPWREGRSQILMQEEQPILDTGVAA
jgi:hypothetical protein